MRITISSSDYKLYQVVIILTTIIYLSFGCQAEKSEKLIIATAANAQYAIEEIAEDFKNETGFSYSLIISSSGKHTAQIEAGAPYDIFISADVKFPQTLFEKGLTIGAPQVYAYGKLIIWSLHDSIEVSTKALTSPFLKHIAMPNPKTAPYGRAAKEFLESRNLFTTLSSKLVFGSSVAQTNQFILSKSAELGFTAASIVMSPTMKNKGHWQEVDKSTYSPIAQGAVVIKSSAHQESALQFYNYLFSKKAQDILVKHGYSLKNSSL